MSTTLSEAIDKRQKNWLSGVLGSQTFWVVKAVNDAPAVERLQALGTDGIITDRVDLFCPV